MKDEKNSFDLGIVGGGAGAFAAAIRANELGAKTLLVNAGLPWGGTCVNVGCVPSKALLWAGETLHESQKHGIPGIEFQLKERDFSKIIRDERALVGRLQQEKYEKVLKNLEHVTTKEGMARFVSPHEVIVNDEKLYAEKFIIATGSTATVPPIEGIRETGFITHAEALKLTKQPRNLTVIGAGPVGVEFAQMFSRLGTQVTVLQRAKTILPQIEGALTEQLTKILTEEGVTFVTEAQVVRAYRDGEEKVVVWRTGGSEHEVRGDAILLAAGKTANTAALDLDAAGVETDARKSIIVTPTLRTTNPALWAVGDVTNAPLRLETTAGHEGTLAAENALTGTAHTIDYNTVPFAVFTDPQIAGVGTSETRQMKEGGVCNCRTLSFDAIPKALIMRRTEGLIHMAVDTRSPKIVGIHILAPQAAELIYAAAHIVKNGSTLDDVIHSLPVFPTLTEAIKLAALSFTKDIHNLSCCI